METVEPFPELPLEKSQSSVIAWPLKPVLMQSERQLRQKQAKGVSAFLFFACYDLACAFG